MNANRYLQILMITQSRIADTRPFPSLLFLLLLQLMSCEKTRMGIFITLKRREKNRKGEKETARKGLFITFEGYIYIYI